MTVQQRFIRLRDAPAYLGMDRNRFNTEVRPHVRVVPIGIQGIAFDRLDLDAWVDQYVERNEFRPVGDAIGGQREQLANISRRPVGSAQIRP